MASNDLLEREQQAAGNAEDSRNPGRFSPKKNAPQDEIDQDFDDILARNGLDASDAKVDSHGDTVQRNYNADDPDTNIQNAKEKEESGAGGLYNKAGGLPGGGAKGMLAKFGGKKALPSAGILGLLVAGILSTASLGPVALFASIEKSMTNDSADYTRTNFMMNRAYMGGLFNSENCKKGLQCKLVTMTKNQLKKWKEEKFAIKGDVIDKEGNPVSEDRKTSGSVDPEKVQDGERIKVQAITFPNGNEVTSNTAFESETNRNIDSKRTALRAFHTKSSYYMNAKFKKVLGKFKLSKGMISTKDSKKQDKDKNKAKATIDAAADKAKEKHLSGRDKIFKNGIKGDVASSSVLAACAVYNTTRTIVAIVKIQWIADIVAFAFPFVQLASKMADGSVTEADFKNIEERANQLTWYPNADYTEKQIKKVNEDSELDANEKKEEITNLRGKQDLTATDAQGLRMALYGDLTKLKEFTEHYTTGGLSAAMFASNAIRKTQDTFGKDNIRATCINAARAGWVSAGVQLATCLVPPGLGCLIKFAAGFTAALAFMLAAHQTLEALIPYLVKALSNATISSDLRGVDAGNALAAGIGLMLSKGSMGYGLQPAGGKNATQKIQRFITATDDVYYQNFIALRQDDARKNPFDAMNQYSFAGQLVPSLVTYISGKKTGFSMMANMVSTVSTALVPSANALHSSPSLMTHTDEQLKHRLDSCSDQFKKDIEVACDWSGRIVGVTSDNVLQWSRQMAADDPKPLRDTIDYLQQEGAFENVGEQGQDDGGTFDDTCNDSENFFDGVVLGSCDDSKKPSIDENGAVVEGSEYSKYIKYCTEEREDDIGMTQEGVEMGSAREQDWLTGKQCARNSMMMDRFTFWYNYCESQYATTNNTTDCFGNDETATVEETVTSGGCEGGGRKAIYTCALKYDDYRYKWGGGHGGNAQEWIKDFKAGTIPKWTDILDCSGLVRMAYVEAMGKEAPANTAPEGFDSDTAHWQKIPLEQAEQGDIVTASGHVAIVQSNDKGGKKFKIFHASTSGEPKESNILHGEQSYGSTIAAFRAK